jgi:flagellar basal-body rod modification protein FlgD
MVNPLDATLSPLGALSSSLAVPQAAPKGELGQQDFLHLMLTQLKNQDPFKPMESGEFLGQLAQFGTVQGLAGLQTSFDGLASSLVSNQALQASALVGRSALAETSTLAVAAGQPVSGAVDLQTSAPAVTVAIQDASGQTVRTLKLGAQPPGLAAFEWDGLDSAGKRAPAGRYTFAATYPSSTETVVADTLLRAPIDSVLLGTDGFSVELRGIGEVPFNAVREIRNETFLAAQAAAGASAD